MSTIEAVPTITTAGDRARTRRTDKATSHHAADVSQRGLALVKANVLFVFAKNDSARGLTGSEVNDLYQFTRARLNWDMVHFDTPRKRAGELAEEGYLEIIGTRPSFGRGQSSSESVYRLTAKGRKIGTLGRGRNTPMREKKATR